MKIRMAFLIGTLIAAAACFRINKEPLVDLAAQTLPTAVMIQCDVNYVPEGSTETKRGAFIGSGVFISPNGHILTAAHLFNHDVTSITVTTFRGDVYAAELLYNEPRRDLALLKINTQGAAVPYATIADPRSLRVGQSVIAIGYPMGLDFSVCHGIISSLGRDFKHAYNVTQSDAMINPGNSGGPLFNLNGELVGINSFIILAAYPIPINSGLGFSVSPGQIIEFLTRFKGLEKAVK